MYSKFCFTGLIFLCISHLVLSLVELNSTLDHDHDHNHDHDHGMPPKDWFLDQIFKEFASNTNTISSQGNQQNLRAFLLSHFLK